MQRIPIRHINGIQKEPDFSGNFSIRDIHGLLAGKDMVQYLYRHDFFYVLALKNGGGNHDIDFTPYHVEDNSVFFVVAVRSLLTTDSAHYQTFSPQNLLP